MPTRRRRPRIGRPPGATSQGTRARILSAARHCFARTGYAGTTNQDIASRAGITAAAVYRYFDSKAALYLATVRDAQSELVPEFERAVAAQPSTRDALRALLSASARLHVRDPSLASFLSAIPVEMQREPAIAEAMASSPSPVLDVVARLVERGVEAGEIDRRDEGRVVAVFLASTMGFSLYAATMESGDFEATMGAFLELLDGGLVRGADGPPAQRAAPALRARATARARSRR